MNHYHKLQARVGDTDGMTSRPRRSYGPRNDSADPVRNRYVDGTRREEPESTYRPRMSGKAARRSDGVTVEDLLWSE